MPGIALDAGPNAIRATAERADVARIYPLPTDTVSNAGAAQLTHVLRTWRALGDLGRGVKVGIDTGIDFTTRTSVEWAPRRRTTRRMLTRPTPALGRKWEPAR